MFEIEMYETENKKCPVKDFLQTLNKEQPKLGARVFKMIELLEQNGNMLRQPNSAPIEDGIFELKIDKFDYFVRILYFFTKDRKIILTNGFLKKTNKTPKSEIELAQKYKTNYLTAIK